MLNLKKYFALCLTLSSAYAFSENFPLELALTSQVSICDAVLFQKTWQTYQETTAYDKACVTATYLLQLAQDIRSQKNLEKTKKLHNIIDRVAAGISGGTIGTGFVMLVGLIA